MQKGKLRLGITSHAAGLLGVIVALLRIVQYCLCTICEPAIVSGFGTNSGGRIIRRRTALARVVELSLSGGHVFLLGEVGSLQDNDESTSIHLLERRE